MPSLNADYGALGNRYKTCVYCTLIYISLKTVPVILVGAYLHFSVLIVFSFRTDAAVVWFRSESAK